MWIELTHQYYSNGAIVGTPSLGGTAEAPFVTPVVGGLAGGICTSGKQNTRMGVLEMGCFLRCSYC